MNVKLKFGLITLSIIIFQSFLKIFGVILTNSLSFLSETVDTIVDIGFISLTLYFLYQSEKPADFDHMYGHSKIDSIGALIQGIILIIVYILLIFNAIQTLLEGVIIINNPETGIYLLIISFVVNVVFSRLLIRKGKTKKSLSLEIQGLNLFQDSLRALLVLFSFILTLFGLSFFDPIISMALSLWIIIGASKLLKEGINTLLDVNPINKYKVEGFRQAVFNLKHVNGVNDLKLRSNNEKLFIEMVLSVEDHISVARANEITKTTKSLGEKLFPLHDIEMVIEMNPLASEASYKEKIMNIIYSLKSEYPEIMEFKDFNLFSFEEKMFLSLTILMDSGLSLKRAHDISTQFEGVVKEFAPKISRIITHIEPQLEYQKKGEEKIEFAINEEKVLERLKKEIEEILRKHEKVKGYHGFEFWDSLDYLILEIHIFFNGNLNISQVHDSICEIEREIKEKFQFKKVLEIIIHSEPSLGRTDGIILNT